MPQLFLPGPGTYVGLQERPPTDSSAAATPSRASILVRSSSRSRVRARVAHHQPRILRAPVVSGQLVTFAATVVGQGSVTAQADRTRALDVPVAGAGSITAQADLTRSFDVSVAGQGAITAQADRTRALDVTVAGQGSVTAQADVTRGFSATVSGQGTVVVADTVTNYVRPKIIVHQQRRQPARYVRRLPSYSRGVGAASATPYVRPAVTVHRPNRGPIRARRAHHQPRILRAASGIRFVTFAANVVGQGAITVAVSRTVTFAATPVGVGSVTVATSGTLLLSASVSGQGSLTASLSDSVRFAATVAGQGAVSAATSVSATVIRFFIPEGANDPFTFAYEIVDVGAEEVGTFKVGSPRATTLALTPSSSDTLAFSPGEVVLAGERLAGTFLVGSIHAVDLVLTAATTDTMVAVAAGTESH